MTTGSELRPPLMAVRDRPFAIVLKIEGAWVHEATFRAQVRHFPQAPGAPLINMQMTEGEDADGIRVLERSEDPPFVAIQLQANRQTINAMPRRGPRGEDQVYAWDLDAALAPGLWERWLYSDFILKEGVTRG